MRWFISALLISCFILGPDLMANPPVKHPHQDHPVKVEPRHDRYPIMYPHIMVPVFPPYFPLEPREMPWIEIGLPFFVIIGDQVEDSEFNGPLAKVRQQRVKEALSAIASKHNLMGNADVNALLQHDKALKDLSTKVRLRAKLHPAAKAALEMAATPANPHPFLNWLENGGAAWLWQIAMEVAQIYGIHLPPLVIPAPVPVKPAFLFNY